MKIYTLLLTLVILSQVLFGQSVVDNYTTLNTGSNGLLDSRVMSLAYGPSGKIWMATADGISTFDGSIWSFIKYEELHPDLDKYIRLFTDSDGNLWINRFLQIGPNLLLRYNGNTIEEFGTTNGYFGSPQESNMYEDVNGNIYIQNPASLIEFSNNTFNIISIPSGQLTGQNLLRDAWGKLLISDNNKTYRESSEGWYEMYQYGLRQMVTTPDSITWLASGGFFASFYKDSLLSEHTAPSLQTSSVNLGLYFYPNAITDNGGNFWSHPWGYKGLLKYDGTNFDYYYSGNSGFYSDIFHDELLLDNGMLWFSSHAGGIVEWDGSQFNHINTFDGLVNNSINCILPVSDKVFFGTQNGSSFMRANSWQSFHYGNDYNYGTGSQINDIFYLGYNSYLLVSGNNGVRQITVFDTLPTIQPPINNGTRNAIQSANKILEGFNSDFWVGHQSGLAHFTGDSSQFNIPGYWDNLTTSNGLPNDTVYDLCKDNSGTIWCATANGIASYQNNTFTVYNTGQGLINNQTRCVCLDTYDNLWVGTTAGLSKYDGVNWQNYTAQDGLAGNFVNDIFEDTDGNLWFGTDQGLSKFSNQSFTNFTTTESLTDNHINCIAQDDDGNLWVGTNFGISKLSTAQQAEEIQELDYKLNVYPNPASETISLKLHSPGTEVAIFNSTGMLAHKMFCCTNLQQIDISSLPVGNYYVRAVGKEKATVGRFAVVR